MSAQKSGPTTGQGQEPKAKSLEEEMAEELERGVGARAGDMVAQFLDRPPQSAESAERFARAALAFDWGAWEAEFAASGERWREGAAGQVIQAAANWLWTLAAQEEAQAGAGREAPVVSSDDESAPIDPRIAEIKTRVALHALGGLDGSRWEAGHPHGERDERDVSAARAEGVQEALEAGPRGPFAQARRLFAKAAGFETLVRRLKSGEEMGRRLTRWAHVAIECWPTGDEETDRDLLALALGHASRQSVASLSRETVADLLSIRAPQRGELAARAEELWAAAQWRELAHRQDPRFWLEVALRADDAGAVRWAAEQAIAAGASGRDLAGLEGQAPTGAGPASNDGARWVGAWGAPWALAPRWRAGRAQADARLLDGLFDAAGLSGPERVAALLGGVADALARPPRETLPERPERLDGPPSRVSSLVERAMELDAEAVARDERAGAWLAESAARLDATAVRSLLRAGAGEKGQGLAGANALDAARAAARGVESPAWASNKARARAAAEQAIALLERQALARESEAGVCAAEKTARKETGRRL
jgi:hypothetical protein